MCTVELNCTCFIWSLLLISDVWFDARGDTDPVLRSCFMVWWLCCNNHFEWCCSALCEPFVFPDVQLHWPEMKCNAFSKFVQLWSVHVVLHSSQTGLPGFPFLQVLDKGYWWNLGWVCGLQDLLKQEDWNEIVESSPNSVGADGASLMCRKVSVLWCFTKFGSMKMGLLGSQHPLMWWV